MDPKDSFKRKTKQSSLQVPQRTNDSMLAEEGSDASNGSKEHITGAQQHKGTEVAAPPKPARGLPLDIPDVIGGNHHHHHQPHPQNHHNHNNHHRKQPQNNTSNPQPTGGSQITKTSSPSNQTRNSRYSLSSSGQGQRISLSSSVSGGDNSGGAVRQRNQRNSTNSHTLQQKTPLTSSQTSLSSDPITEVRTFSRKPRGKLLVIFPFEVSFQLYHYFKNNTNLSTAIF